MMELVEMNLSKYSKHPRGHILGVSSECVESVLNVRGRRIAENATIVWYEHISIK